MSWKVPIDTEHDTFFGSDFLCCDLFRHLLIKARTDDMKKPEFHEGKPYTLKRGQAIYGRLNSSKRLRASPSGTDRALLRLEKVYSIVTCERNKNYTIVTIKNYDQEIEMNKQVNNRRTSEDTKVNTNKNDKSVKSEENNNTKVLKQSLEKQSDETSLTVAKEFGRPDINECLSVLKKMNGSVSQVELNRYAIKRLIASYNVETVKRMMTFAYQVRGKQFAPLATNYIQLEKKWHDLIAYAQRLRDEKKNSSSAFYEQEDQIYGDMVTDVN